MNFYDIEYFLLLVFSALLYFIVPFRHSWLLLLMVSYFFYSYSQLDFIWLLFISTIIDFGCGFYLGRIQNRKSRKMLLLLSIGTNVSILAYFKYRLLIDDALVYIFDSSSFLSGPAAQFILPIGISFFTLQSMGYTIDVYRGHKKAEKHFGYFALYVAYFPQLIAGPIERANNLLPQLKTCFAFDWERIRSGITLILSGLFKKLVIVGSLSPLMDTVYQENAQYTWLEVALAAIFSMFYIYMDFSSYTDLARGSARIYGVNLTQNFKRPFGATSVREFWRRWHISLTRWVFDYLHQPLKSLSSNTYWRYYLTIITFTIVGLWHGAAITFILWGFINGVYIAIEKTFSKYNLTWPTTKCWNYLKQLRTIVLVNIAGVFFLSPSIAHSINVFRNLLAFDTSIYFSNEAILWPSIIAFVSSIIWYFAREIADNQKSRSNWPLQNTFLRWFFYLSIITYIVTFSAPNQNAFIYFQF